MSLQAFGQEQILEGLPKGEGRLWMRLLAPDDATDGTRNVLTLRGVAYG